MFEVLSFVNDSLLAYLNVLTPLFLAIYFWKHFPYDPVGESDTQVYSQVRVLGSKGNVRKN